MSTTATLPEHGKKIGVGSTRVVYEIDNDRVLKVVLEDPCYGKYDGIESNKNEILFSQMIEGTEWANHFAKVLDHDESSEPEWLIMERIHYAVRGFEYDKWNETVGEIICNGTNIGDVSRPNIRKNHFGSIVVVDYGIVDEWNHPNHDRPTLIG